MTTLEPRFCWGVAKTLGFVRVLVSLDDRPQLFSLLFALRRPSPGERRRGNRTRGDSFRMACRLSAVASPEGDPGRFLHLCKAERCQDAGSATDGALVIEGV